MTQPATIVDQDTDMRATERRRGLALLAAATGGALSTPLAGIAVGDLATWEFLGVPKRIDALERFRRAVDGDAIRRLAEDYLDASHDPPSAAWLVARVLEEADPDEDVRAYMRRKVTADYEALRTHSFDGWLVSRTEARLLSVLALTA
ncbi:MAG: hypothetical protein OEU54_00325 [Gemmatimonadota bacterium]|nr:hypothetical protein [Gemmatimonadota bacterium]